MAAPSEEPVGEERPSEERRLRPVLRLLQGLSLLAVAGLLALLVWRLIDSERGAKLVAAVQEGKAPAAPNFLLAVLWPRAGTWPRPLRHALGDGQVSLHELRGYPVVINFWASWCRPCKAEAPRLTASARQHSGEVVFVGIDIEDFRSAARRFLRRYDTNYVAVRDPAGSTFDGYGLTGIPETYYVDRRGRLVAHDVGEISRRELELQIAKLVRQ